MELWAAAVSIRNPADVCQSFLCAEGTNDPRLCTRKPTMKCPQCEAKLCSTECYRRSWKNHKILHKIRDDIVAKGGPDAQHKISSIVIPVGSYYGETKINVPIGISIEQPALDGRGQINCLGDGCRINGTFVNGVPAPYSKKHFPLGFDGPGGHHEVYSGHYDRQYRCSGDGMRVYANGDYFIGRWEYNSRAEGRMVGKNGHVVYDGIVTNGIMTRGKIYYRQKYFQHKAPQEVEPYGIAVPTIVELETDVWDVTCSPAGDVMGPTVITFHRGDVFECVMRESLVDLSLPHKLTYADGSVDTATIPAEVAGRGSQRFEVMMNVGDEGRVVMLVTYAYN